MRRSLLRSRKLFPLLLLVLMAGGSGGFAWFINVPQPPDGQQLESRVFFAEKESCIRYSEIVYLIRNETEVEAFLDYCTNFDEYLRTYHRQYLLDLFANISEAQVVAAGSQYEPGSGNNEIRGIWQEKSVGYIWLVSVFQDTWIRYGLESDDFVEYVVFTPDSPMTHVELLRDYYDPFISRFKGFAAGLGGGLLWSVWMLVVFIRRRQRSRTGTAEE